MIEVSNLNFGYKTFKKKPGLKGSLQDFFNREVIVNKTIKDISFSVKQGEMIGLLGKNGAGKTTLIKLLVGLIHPNSGTIKIMGHTPYKKKNSFLRQIGLVLGQKSQLIWDLPPSDTLEMLRDIYSLDADTYKSYVSELIDNFDVREKFNTPVRKLSLGERMKFEIIASLIHKPKLLFLDEPTIGLDINTQKKIHDFLKLINRKYNTTIILTSHYMKDIEVLSNRILIIDDGEIICDKSLESLLDEYHEEEVLVIESCDEMEINDLFREVKLIKKGTYEVKLFDKINSDYMKKIVNDLNDVKSITTKKIPLEDVIFSVFNSGM